MPSAVVPAPKPTDAEDSLLKYAKDMSAALMAHLKAKYPDSIYTQKLVVNLEDIRLMPEFARKSALGLSSSRTGIIELNVQNQNSTLRPRDAMLDTLLHEMGHIATSFGSDPGGPHGPNFTKGYMWLANVATKDLKWKVTTRCSVCDMYNICDKGVCPACQWDCPGPLKHTRPQKPPTPHVFDFNTWGVPAYQRLCVKKTPTYAWHKSLCASRTANKT